MSKYIIALSTCKTEDAVRISRALVESKKCACVNIIKGIRSIYHWKGVIEDGEESILLMKTEEGFEEELRNILVSIHPYETPEFITIAIRSGATSYLDWISANVE